MSRRKNSSPRNKLRDKWQMLSELSMSSYKNLQISSVHLWPWLVTLEFGIGVTSKTSKHCIGNRHNIHVELYLLRMTKSERARILLQAIISLTRMKCHRSVLSKISVLDCCAARSDHFLVGHKVKYTYMGGRGSQISHWFCFSHSFLFTWDFLICITPGFTVFSIYITPALIFPLIYCTYR